MLLTRRGSFVVPPQDDSRHLEQHHFDRGAGVQPAGVERYFQHAVGADQGKDQVRLAKHGHGIQTTIGIALEPDLDLVLATRCGGDVAAQPRLDRAAWRTDCT